MNKIINLLVAALFLLLNSCNTHLNLADFLISETEWEEISLAVNPVTYSLRITNNNNYTAAIHWDRVENSTVAGWSYEIDGNTTNTGILNIPAQTTISISFSIFPSGNAGSGDGYIEFYEPAHQQLSRKTFNYQLDALNEYFSLKIETTPSFTGALNNSPPQYSYAHYLRVINNNNIPIPVKWARTEENRIPSAWQLAVKTHRICYTPVAMTDLLGIIPPMDTVPFELIFCHNNVSGQGASTPIFWVDTDSINSVKSQTFTYEAL